MAKKENLSEIIKSVEEHLLNNADSILHPYIEQIVQNAINNYAKNTSEKSEFEKLAEYRRYPYYSQVGQDRYLNEYIFKDKKNGFFVDIGAYDGYTISNSYFFEDKRDWDGICIEPMPHIFKKLQKQRKCKCIRAAISSIKGKIDFLVDNNFDMLSCIYQDKYKSKIENGNARIIKVPSVSLSEILEGIDHPIDFISIDTEGTALEILKSFDITKYDVRVFIIESDHKEEEIKNYLTPFGYKYLVTLANMDSIFVKEDIYYEIINSFKQIPSS